ncbi:hypothetical protein GF373_04480, partial [bacterium]|nr:hypothetical protein [bacterium]
MNSASEKMKKSEPKRTWRIRPYTADDRQAVRDICCETGYSGQPIDPIFSDRDVFADFFTRYYTDFEPDAALVVEDQGKIVGYLIGCTRYRLHAIMEKFLVAFVIAPKVIWRMATGRYNRSDRNFLWWSLTRGNKETPAAPKRSSHFHFNLLSAYRAQGVGPALLY